MPAAAEMSPRSRARRPWRRPSVAAGSVLTYGVVGQVLSAPAFLNDLPIFLTSPGTVAEAGSDRVAPFVLLVIPAVLGGMGTRAILERVLDGMARRDSLASIALAVGSMLLAGIVYVLLALFSSGREGH